MKKEAKKEGEKGKMRKGVKSESKKSDEGDRMERERVTEGGKKGRTEQCVSGGRKEG